MSDLLLLVKKFKDIPTSEREKWVQPKLLHIQNPENKIKLSWLLPTYSQIPLPLL